MMNNSICRLFAGIWAFLLLSSAPCHARGPIAHYIITKEALGTNGAEVAPYSNLPDVWPSQTGPLAWLDTGIYFRWSHGVIDNGHYNVYLGLAWLPKKPTFPDDGRYPGEVMKDLIAHKFDNANGKWGNLDVLRKVQRGFRAHNAADRVVHWEFFLGATDAMTNSEKQDAWTVHHGLKETWAEYIILAQQYLGQVITFQDTGSIAPPQTCQSLGIPNLNTNAIYMAKLLRTAQGAYRKNRTIHCVADGSEDYDFVPQAASEIATIIQDFNAELLGHFNKSHWALWEAGNINFLSDYVKANSDGSTTSVIFETPNTLEAEYALLNFAKEKLNNELALKTRREALGFLWEKSILFNKMDNSKTLVIEWGNQ